MSAGKRYDTFLFDLDGTLLDLDFHRFVRDYYRMLAERASSYIPPDVFLVGLERGVAAIAGNDGSRTNADAFFEEFERHCGPVSEAFMDSLREFYERDFGNLRVHGRPVPGMREALSLVKQAGAKVVLATNPLFPRRAVEHRVAWAGLAGFPFDLVTTYETMHAAKPSPRYFEEVLRLVDAQPDRALMVGDDPELDLPAASIGIDVWLLGDSGTVIDVAGAARGSGSVEVLSLDALLERLRALASSP